MEKLLANDRVLLKKCFIQENKRECDTQLLFKSSLALTKGIVDKRENKAYSPVSNHLQSSLAYL